MAARSYPKERAYSSRIARTSQRCDRVSALSRSNSSGVHRKALDRKRPALVRVNNGGQRVELLLLE